MSCCPHCRGAEAQFDRGEAAYRLARYRRHGPERTTRWLLDALSDEQLPGATVLDIGGGVGALHHELLKGGAANAVDVDASRAYLDAAREESARLGHTERVTYLHGDFVALAEHIQPADIVALDRVVCCYPDMPALVGAAAARARHRLGLVYPRDTWWVRAGTRVINLGFALQRTAFRIFCHPTAAVDKRLQQEGLQLHSQRMAGPWQIAVYQRVG
jgi:2-polyprenyl-3-methyl-5-hydroxy-6-metoxy-1,4-benzoquinol methylase